MNDSTPFDTIGDEPVEARIVSWVLGEASAFEAAELERLCEERPELLVFRRRMRALHGLLTEAEATETDHSWKLPKAKRKALDEIFGEEKPARPEPDKESQIRRSGRRALLAIAACVLLTLFLGAVFSAGNASIQKARKNKQNIQYSAAKGAADEKIDFLPGGGGGGGGWAGGVAKHESDEKSDVENFKGDIDIVGGGKFALKALPARLKEGKDEVDRSVSAIDKRMESSENQELRGLNTYRGGVAETAPAAAAAPQSTTTSSALADSQQPTESEKALVDDKGNLAWADRDGGKTRNDSALRAARPRIIPGEQSALAEGDADSAPRSPAARDFISPVNGTSVDGIPADPNQLALNGVTNGLRSGDQAINRNNIDAILNNPNRTAGEATSPTTSASGPAPAEFAMRLGVDIPQKSKSAKAKEGAGSGAGLALGDRDVNTYTGATRAGAGTLTLRDSSNFAYDLKSEPTKNQPPIAAADVNGGTLDVAGVAAVPAPAAMPHAADGMLQQNGDKSVGGRLASNADRDRESALYLDSTNAPSKPAADDELQAAKGLFLKGRGDSGYASGGKPANLDDQEIWNKSGMDKSSSAGPIRTDSALTSDQAGKVDQVRRGLYVAEGNLNLGKYDQAKTEYENVLRSDPYNAAARAGLEKISAAKTDYYRAAYDQTRAELLMQVDEAWELKVPTDSEAKKESAVAAMSLTAEVSKAKAAPAKISPLESMEEIAAGEEPYSTFSLNINDASFQIAKAALDKGERPDPAAIKVEQFYNAVDYGDPAPASNEPVAATIEQSAHPVIPGRNIVRVALKTAAAGRGASQPLRLTLLVDQSGSMVREDRRAAMSNALKQLGGLLTPNDHITVVGFSRESHLLADNWTGDQSGKLGDLVNQTASEGGTNLEQAINLGEQMAARPHPAGEQNRIVLFTDGAANLGNANPERLAERVKSLRQKGIAFDIAGIGADGVNDRLLSELARNGNGRYYVVGDTKNESFARQLAGAFRPAAENVKVQVRFNPDRVGNYKLIGFEKDRLKTEDFRNDAVDAAELAAEEAGVAIYQVETLPQGSGEIGEVSVRFRDTSKGEMVERKWTMPFESTTQPFDRATPSMQLAGLSMLAAEKLKGGPLADAIDFKQLAGPQSLVKQFYGSSPRVADMLHVTDQLK